MDGQRPLPYAELIAPPMIWPRPCSGVVSGLRQSGAPWAFSRRALNDIKRHKDMRSVLPRMALGIRIAGRGPWGAGGRRGTSTLQSVPANFLLRFNRMASNTACAWVLR